MEIIQLTRHLGSTSLGSSQTQIFADKDGKVYYVKYKENAQSIRILVNEYVAGKIAKDLKLPCPECFIVEIDDTLVTTLPAINNVSITNKYHFATSKIDNIHNLPPIRQYISQCVNKHTYPCIILFDVLTFNLDRGNNGNFIISIDNGKYLFNIIDHGHCFHYTWDTTRLPTLIGNWPGHTTYLPELYSEINDSLNFNDAIERIEALPDDFFSNLVDEIPDDWLVNLTEKAVLKSYLISQRGQIRNLVRKYKALLFTNWI